jgi:hypothetical protein
VQRILNKQVKENKMSKHNNFMNLIKTIKQQAKDEISYPVKVNGFIISAGTSNSEALARNVLTLINSLEVLYGDTIDNDYHSRNESSQIKIDGADTLSSAGGKKSYPFDVK